MSKKKSAGRKAAKVKSETDPSPEDEADTQALNALMTELESDLRDEQLKRVWDRYRYWIYALLAVLVLGVAVYQYLEGVKVEQLNEQANAYARATDDIETGNLEEALAELMNVSGQGGNYGALASLRQASILIEQGNLVDAIAIYRSLSQDLSLDTSFKDLATLLWALHGLDMEDPSVIEEALLPLTSPDNAYGYSALELMALLAAKRGQLTKAIDILGDLLSDANTPSTIRARAEELVAVYQSPNVVSPSLNPSAVLGAGPKVETP